ncbi:NAD(+)/NADH kinase [Candidatus Poriferisodalis sp.]|uniref:NAD(+)/NADH kinase n=1 Tax=Candidatus Poriferisodalis sp. TaxID=3101277 RepID=UPI003B018A97
MSEAAGYVVGIVANPLAGKDVRRLTSGATPVSDAVKIGVIRRAVVGAFEGGAGQVMISGDRARLGERAVAGLDVAPGVQVFEPYGWHNGRDSQMAASEFRERGVGAVIALGGDGTQRDVAKGWRDVPLVPLAVGTNNVFPLQMEATVAGFAAGAVASNQLAAADVTSRSKIIDVAIEGTRHADVALVDVCLVRGAFVGARAVWDSASVSEIVAAVAEPQSVGLSAIAAAVAPVGRRDAGGVHVGLECASRDAQGIQRGRHIRAAVMPGSYSDLDIAHCEMLRFGQPVMLSGPGVLTLDGEREIVLGPRQRATVTVNPDGPQLIDVGAAVAMAQRRRYPFGPATAGR